MTAWDSTPVQNNGAGSAAQRGILVKNSGGTDIPSLGVCKPTGWDSTRRCLTVAAVDAARQKVLIINQGGGIEAGGYGYAIVLGGNVFFAKYDTVGSVGDSYGNDDTSGELVKDRPGMFLLADTGIDSIGMFVWPQPFVCAGIAQEDGDGTVSVKLGKAEGGGLTAVGDAFTVSCPNA